MRLHEPERARALRIGGMTRLTSIDFPERLAAVLFCQGCAWRCSYCHNPELLNAAVPGAVSWVLVERFLENRRGLLDGVVFSGGEPVSQVALPAAITQVRSMGFETALHTAGIYPERLAALLPQLDWVGLDIKGPLHCHDAITGVPGSGRRARLSLYSLLDSGLAYECRTTWHAGLFDSNELMELADELAGLGVTHWVLQECRTVASPPWRLTSAQLQKLTGQFKHFALRRA